MIICLFESNYPINREGEPNWEELPVGYFECDRNKLRQIASETTVNLYGTLIFAERENFLRPRSGEHLLAVFSYKQKRYLFNSTLSYGSTDTLRKQKLWVRLGFNAKPIKVW